MFDESYNIREVLDDVIERVNLRERLIQTARQSSDKKRDESYTLALRQFDNLMQDFLRLYQPIIDRLRSHRETLQKDLQSLRTGLSTVVGMLDVARQIDGLAAKVEQLQMDQQDLEKTIDEKAKTLNKIDDLLNRIQPYLNGTSSASISTSTIIQDPMSDVLSGMPKDLFAPDVTSEPAKSPSKRSSRS